MERTGVAEVLTGRQIMRGIDDVARYEDMFMRFFGEVSVISSRSMLNGLLRL